MANQGPQGAAEYDLHRGRRVGKYEIVTLLSVGGMAELFLAFTAGPGGFRKFVALKQILPEVQKDESFVQMFLDEARITAALSHANIGQVFDLGEQDGEMFLAMEFLAGQNLEQVLQASTRQQRLLPMGFSARAVRDACLGLHYAHHFTDPSGKPRPVVHRDVSPRNVMVTFDGHVKVIDFGIAKAKGRLGRTQVGMVKGTTGYMSPEQVQGMENLDGRSDLFCAGILLHEMLCGRRLFTGAHEIEVMTKIADARVPSPSSLNPRVPQALSDVVMRALSRDPAGRFASGREMARAIEAACGAELFHEEQLATVMRQLFEDKIQKTRALLESANQTEAAPAGASLGETEADPPTEQMDRTRIVPMGQAGPPQAPPPPPAKPAPRRPTAQAVPARAPATRASAPPRPPAPAPIPFASEPQEPEEEDALALTQPIRGKKYAAPAANAVTKPEPRVERAPQPEESVPSTVTSRAALVSPEEPRKGSGAGRWLLGVLLLAVLGGALAVPPVRARLSPLFASVLKTVKGNEPPHGPPPAEPLAIPTPPPTASQEPVAEHPSPPPPSPEKPAPTPEPAPAAVAPPAPSKADTKRTRKTAPESKSKQAETKPAATPDAEAEPEVIDTSTAQGAAKAQLGWLSLRTVPRAAVFDGDNDLGTTPLRRVPLPVATYRLKVVDPDGANRVLSVPIKPGQLTDMTVQVSDLPLWEEHGE